jgi:UDP-N-acetylglucosamine 2-epimerase (non-hydrolysing)
MTLIDPLGYIEFMSLVCSAAGLLTDSGGVQEETTYLGIPCFTLRDNTERPVTVASGTNTLLGLAPARIAEVPSHLAGIRQRRAVRIPGWDGAAAQRLVEILARADLPSRIELTARNASGDPMSADDRQGGSPVSLTAGRR